jgi:hypothetical protein
MSGDIPSENPLFIGEFDDVRLRSSTFVHAISVVNRWLADGVQISARQARGLSDNLSRSPLCGNDAIAAKGPSPSRTWVTSMIDQAMGSSQPAPVKKNPFRTAQNCAAPTMSGNV